MISIYKHVLLSGIIALSFNMLAQQAPSTKKADKDFQSYAYAEAIKRYESVPNKTTDINRKLAESYQKTGNTGKAEQYLASVATATDANSHDVYNYFYILRENGKYEESETWIKKYQVMDAADSRAKSYTEHPGSYERLKKDDGRFKIKNLDVNTDAQDFGTAFDKDHVVFASTRSNQQVIKREWNWNGKPFLNLYEAKKADNYELSEIKSFTKKINHKYHEGPASFSGDGNWMAYTTDNYTAKGADGVTRLELFYAVKRDGKWQQSFPFSFNNKDYSVGHPSVSKDGKTLYFTSDMPGGMGGTDIYKTVLGADGKWSDPQNLGNKINTEGNEMFPFVHESGVLFYSSDGRIGLGGLDVFAVKIKENGFSKVLNLGVPVNDDKDDFAFVLDSAQKGGYFSSNRDGGKGDDDIYSFNMLKPLKFGKLIKGTAKDKDGNILDSTIVNLYDVSGHVINTVTTAANGSYAFEVEDPANYKLAGTRQHYFDGKTDANLTDQADEITSDVILEKDPGVSLVAVVSDAKTRQPLEGVTMKITNTEGKHLDYVTPATGDYRESLPGKKIGDKIVYKMELTKEGYLSKVVEFEKLINKPGEMKIQDDLDLSMGKIEVGTDIGKLVNIKPIYFDVNKSKIRPDAAVELDKIVKAMVEYPGMVIELGSHTDCRAAASYNMALSDKRAKSSAAYIVSKGISKDRIYGKGYGESRLLNGCACEGKVKSNCTEEEHQANRRTEFIIVKIKG